MDFSSELMQGQGHGQYINLEMTHLPQFWLAYLNDPSDSGRIHSNVKARWERGDNEVHDAMKQFGELTSKARVAIEEQDWNT
jgi:glucuronokinase